MNLRKFSLPVRDIHKFIFNVHVSLHPPKQAHFINKGMVPCIENVAVTGLEAGV